VIEFEPSWVFTARESWELAMETSVAQEAVTQIATTELTTRESRVSLRPDMLSFTIIGIVFSDRSNRFCSVLCYKHWLPR
jgi:hypothetical protein